MSRQSNTGDTSGSGAGRNGHMDPHRAVDSIRVGYRHRVDMGNLDELCASIQRIGLLQPITISLEGTLLCGARRLAAVKKLGQQTVKVFVRAGMSGRLEHLLAEQEENNHKPFTPTEAASLYQELTAIFAEDAARRKEASRFGADGDRNSKEKGKIAGRPGGAESAPPERTRAKAARMVTGSKSYSRLEQVGELQQLAADDGLPESIRRLAETELAAMDADGIVYGHYATVKAAISMAGLEEVEANADLPSRVRKQAALELDQLKTGQQSSGELVEHAQQALTRVKAGLPTKVVRLPKQQRQARPGRTYGVRVFVATWREMRGWTSRFDPVEIGPALTEEQWAGFETTVEATVVFADKARQARNATT